MRQSPVKEPSIIRGFSLDLRFQKHSRESASRGSRVRNPQRNGGFVFSSPPGFGRPVYTCTIIHQTYAAKTPLASFSIFASESLV